MEVRKHFNVSGGYFERVTSSIIGKWKLLHWSRKILEPYVTVQTMEHSMSPAVNYSMNVSLLKATYGNDTMESSDTEPLSVESRFILILLYTAITLMAIVGNSLAIIIFAKGKRSRTDLRPFLINLAVADLIMGMFCIPFTFTFQILDRWIFTEPMCPIVLFLQVVSVTASVSTNMAIGLDRFYAVKYPLKSRITSSKVRFIIVCIWVFAVGLSSVQLLVGRTTPIGDHVTCAEKWPEPRILLRRIYTLVVLVLTYIMPLLILTVTYTMIGRTLSQHKTPGNADESRDHQQLKSKRKVRLCS